MIKNRFILALTFFNFFYTAQNLSITFGFPEVTTNSGQTDPSNTPTVNGIQFTSFKSTGTSLQPNASGRFSFTKWPVGAMNGDDNYGNYNSVLSPTVYYEVALYVSAGYTLNLNHLTFGVRRSGTGIRNYCVRSSKDNFNNNLAASTSTNTNLSVIPNDVFFWNYDSVSTNNDQRGSQIDFNLAHQGITDSLILRFYAWNAESSGGSFSIDNVYFEGSVIDSTLLSGIYSENLFHTSKIKLYPNPITDKALHIENESAFIQVEIYDLFGKIIISNFLERETKQTQLTLPEITSGKYFVKLRNFNNTLSESTFIINEE